MKTPRPLSLPLAVLVAGALLALAVYLRPSYAVTPLGDGNLTVVAASPLGVASRACLPPLSAREDNPEGFAPRCGPWY